MRQQLTLTALIGALAFAGSAHAAVPVEVFTEAQAGNGETGATFLDTVAVSGGIAYSFLRDAPNVGLTGFITAYNGSTFTTVMNTTNWAATTPSFDMAAGNGAGIVGGKARFVSFFDNAVYDVDLGTGAVSQAVSKATIDGVLGGSANLAAQFKVGDDGTIYSYDSPTDSIIQITPANAVSIEVSTADLAATTIGGLGIFNDVILIGDNTSDSLRGWNTTTNAMSTVLTTAQIDAIASDPADVNDGIVSFGDIYYAPDGLVYFYEGDSDDLLAYNPANPAGSLHVVISEAEFIAGPSSSTINQLAWWDGKIAYTDQSDGFYVVPEPTSLALLAFGGLMVARRRRA